MKQYFRLSDKDTIQTPRELSNKTLGLDKSWGEGLYVQVDLEDGFGPNCYKDKLEDGEAVIDTGKVSKMVDEKKQKIGREKKSALRVKKMIAIRNSIDANKSVDELTAIERKVAYGVGGAPTDSELGIS